VAKHRLLTTACSSWPCIARQHLGRRRVWAGLCRRVEPGSDSIPSTADGERRTYTRRAREASGHRGFRALSPILGATWSPRIARKGDKGLPEPFDSRGWPGPVAATKAEAVAAAQQ
jgi:hypothetical protein